MHSPKLLLTFLDAIGGPVTNADFQARLFLFSREQGASPSYEFVPQKLGAFSFTAEADKRRLSKADLLVEDDQQWRLTEAGQQAAKAHPVNPQLVDRCFRETTGLYGDALIAEQYRRYPYYATQSEVINRLPLKPEVRRRIDEARPAKGKPGLLTIG